MSATPIHAHGGLWDGEIVAVRTDGKASTVWRLAHHRSVFDGKDFWDSPGTQVAENLLDHPWVVNDRDKAYEVLAHRMAQRVQAEADLEDLAQYILRNPFSVEKMTLESPGDLVIYRSRLNAKINRNFEVFAPTDFLT